MSDDTTGDIRIGDYGYPWRMSTNGFDMSASTGLTLNFTKPDGTTLQKTEASTNPVTAPATALTNDPFLGDQAASTYFEFTPVAADFDTEGTWSVCGVYTDATRQLTTKFDVEFEVEPACT